MDPILHRFRDTATIYNFPYIPITPLPFRLKFGGVPFGVDPSCCGLPRVKCLGYISREIIFAEFPTNLYDHDTSTL